MCLNAVNDDDLFRAKLFVKHNDGHNNHQSNEGGGQSINNDCFFAEQRVRFPVLLEDLQIIIICVHKI